MATEGFDGVLNLYKKKSKTPLQTIERFVTMHPEYRGVRMTYAGRLDPMAEGVLLVLCGEKNKERDAYTGLDKDYEFEFMLGVETDTFDILGMIAKTTGKGADTGALEAALKKYEGKITQKYPPYSSKVINGKAMFTLAREGKLMEADIPTHEVEAQKIELLGSKTLLKADFRKYVLDSIKYVEGDFRQKESMDAWEAYFVSAPEEIVIWKARLSCGSGFYVRQLVADVGRDLGTGAVTVSILRTRVGSFVLAESQR
jgi:tRNA pseudouridine55 synthase